MRGLALVALCALMALSSLFILGNGSDASAEGGGPLAELQAVFTSDDAEPGDTAETAPDGEVAAAPTSSFYQYTDDKGRTHFVQSAADIPGRYRKSADTLELRSRIIRPDAPSAEERPTQTRRAYADSGSQTQPRTHARGDVVIYTAPWCGWCRKALAWLDANGVDYENKNIEANPAYRDELVSKTGRASIPVVEIDGQIVQGYSPGQMTQLLGI